MENSNYLIDFSQKLDYLISQINKLNSKVRLYQKNSKIFDMDFHVHFNINPDYFIRLREFLHKKIDEGSKYDKKIVDLKRNFSREYSYLMIKIEKEVRTIENEQEIQMNSIVYKKIYKLKWQKEIDLRDQYNVENSFLDFILCKNKFRKLSYINHDLKAKLIKKEYEENKNNHKNLFELINMIENTDVKDGDLLCLQDEMLKAFMIDKSSIRKNIDDSWKHAKVLPNRLLQKRSYYKKVNRELYLENQELEHLLENSPRLLIDNERNITKENLTKLNQKLSKIILGKVYSNEKN